MNAVQKALADIRFKIPTPILERAFGKNTVYGIDLPTAIDYRIREAVVQARVIPDCNLVGGSEVEIPLIGVVPRYLDPFTIVYRIPKSLTQGRSIIRPLHITYGEGGMNGLANIGTMGGSAMLDAAEGVMRATLPIPIVSTANVSLVADNTVLVKDNTRLPGNLWLKCVVEADSEFSHLQPASVIAFSKLVELATKAWIFVNISVDMDTAQLMGGMALGRFREIVDGYADANELYETFIEEKWRKIAIFNDATARSRHLKMVTGGRH